MKENRSKNKSFSAKGWIAGIITANILGILAWLLPMLCKNWLLSISLESFYAKRTATFMFCATWPILQGIILLYHAKKKRDISISRSTEVDIWMILAINLFALLFVTIANAVMEANNEMLGDVYQQLGEFILRYGGIYVAAMLLSLLFGIAAIRRCKKDDGASHGCGNR